MRGMMTWPGCGSRSKSPKAVRRTLGRERSVAKAGRSVKSVSPFRSRPTVMLKGRPELATSVGFRRRPHGSALMAPPTKKRWRVSCTEFPYSPDRSYWLTGKLAAKSVSLFAKFRT